MIELPPDIPNPEPTPVEIIENCVKFNSQHFGVPELAIKAILDVEGGKMCTVSKNSNGSYDLGPMQINTIHMSSIKEQYPEATIKDIACRPCLNITLGTWILSKRINEVDDIWKGIGNYHSKTPKYHDKYLEKITSSITTLTR
ncbi:lytic transglycosylase domain-containing protein [Pseudoalteromonas sp. OFAV1]|uniref:lytic transglycosylase domain-containing protein n=1 Tax=Pseudoalteromonas sp. OFAV1 TaxID=2908892 RepID=UPI001F3CE470|nr:lytic transglycosylase domain-containing protein [Pseudoalteromonas sp. OFAV1]MCF2901844.1 lytic transglycosylase domain-containing protein [Pseudoalteromonas sp. OFAV1]